MTTSRKTPLLLRRHRWLAGLALGALALPSAGLAETLQGALAKAYENNPTLTAARAGQRANDENVPIQKSYGLPSLGAQGDYTENLVKPGNSFRSEEHTSELQSLMRISYAVFCLKKKTNITPNNNTIV